MEQKNNEKTIDDKAVIEAIKFVDTLRIEKESFERLYDFLLDLTSLEKPIEREYSHNGKLITFDGHSGAGKDTQINLLIDGLKRNTAFDKNIIYGIQKKSDPFRKISKEYWKRENPDVDNSYLLLSAGRRFQFYSTIIEQLENEKNVVILNRGYLSNIAYSAKDNEDIRKMLEISSFDPAADLSLILETDTLAAYERIVKRSPEKGGIIYKNEMPEYIDRVKKNFHELEHLVNGMRVINSTGDKENIATCIRFMTYRTIAGLN